MERSYENGARCVSPYFQGETDRGGLDFHWKIRFWLFLLCLCLLLPTQAQYAGAFNESDFATRVFSWSGLNGVAGYNQTPQNALGYPPPLSTPAVPDNTKLFSFGWGGYIELGFDRPIQNLPGFDFILFGNAFYAGGNPCLAFVEPGYVEVGIDRNLNGIPDSGDEWFLLLPRFPDPRNAEGIPSFPLPSNYFGNVPVCASPIIGYADVTPVSNLGHPLIPDDPYVPGLQNGSAGGDPFDLDWAIDIQTGNSVSLEKAHFLRVRHAGNTVMGVLGQSSTEISAVALMRIPGDVDGNGCVEDSDLLAVLFAFGQQGDRLFEDVNRDGTVDDTDLLFTLFHFGTGC